MYHVMWEDSIKMKENCFNDGGQADSFEPARLAFTPSCVPKTITTSQWRHAFNQTYVLILPVCR